MLMLIPSAEGVDLFKITGCSKLTIRVPLEAPAVLVEAIKSVI